MLELPLIPEDLVRRAYRSGNGELAWIREDTILATEALAAQHYAVWGGEVWLLLDDGNWTGVIPTAVTGPSNIYTWSVEPSQWEFTETWQEYCNRLAKYTVNMLRTIDAEDRTFPELKHRIRYNLGYMAEDGYLE